VSQELVADIWLGRVQRFRVVSKNRRGYCESTNKPHKPDVLSGEEDAECKTVHEVARRQQASDRANTEPSAIEQEGIDIGHLRQVLVTITTVGLEERQQSDMLRARVFLMQRHELVVHNTPCGLLVLGVGDAGNGLSVSVIHGQVRQLLPSLSVHGIRESRVISLQFSSSVEDLVCHLIQLRDAAGEPRHFLRLKHGDTEVVVAEVLQEVLYGRVRRSTFKVNEELVVTVAFGRARLKSGHVD